MPLIKITQKGWEKFNGELEGAQFVDGTSTEELSNMSAERLGCTMSIVDAETGKSISSTQRILDCREVTAAPGRYTIVLEKKEDKPKEEAAAEEAAEAVAKSEKKAAKVAIEFPFTREQLESIADTAGISGLREYAKEYNVNGNSIIGIIDALMAKKEKAA